jgi:pyridoxamine 5'-phosphate oxidase
MADRVGLTLADLRKEYLLHGLTEDDVDPDPFKQFDVWFEQARVTSGQEANAMTVATASKDGVPSARTVLLKGVDNRGFIFFTSYASSKGEELADNPVAALLFYWPSLERQVRVTGPVERLGREESEGYFRSRPRGSQIAATIATQSQMIAGRSILEEAVARRELELEGLDVPMPEWWGGYRVNADWFEFWQGRPNRLHDRLRYRRDDGAWVIERLAP